MTIVRRVEVEVFPIEPGRWIAVICAPQGPFTTEAAAAGQVETETREAIVSALGWADVQIAFVDDTGRPWSPESAEAQASRLLVP